MSRPAIASRIRAISARTRRRARSLSLTCAVAAATGLVAACGTQKVSVPKSNAQLYRGAVLFSQRCSGCHTLSYAGTHGSAVNVRTAQANNGPNFDIRCERPIARVLYAIENGGFSGAIMPQNIVVGQDAIDVAKFVSTYAGRSAPRIPGVKPCDASPVGTVPAPVLASAATSAPAPAPAPRRTSGKAAPSKTRKTKARR